MNDLIYNFLLVFIGSQVLVIINQLWRKKPEPTNKLEALIDDDVVQLRRCSQPFKKIKLNPLADPNMPQPACTSLKKALIEIKPTLFQELKQTSFLEMAYNSDQEERKSQNQLDPSPKRDGKENDFSFISGQQAGRKRKVSTLMHEPFDPPGEEELLQGLPKGESSGPELSQPRDDSAQKGSPKPFAAFGSKLDFQPSEQAQPQNQPKQGIDFYDVKVDQIKDEKPVELIAPKLTEIRTTGLLGLLGTQTATEQQPEAGGVEKLNFFNLMQQPPQLFGGQQPSERQQPGLGLGLTAPEKNPASQSVQPPSLFGGIASDGGTQGQSQMNIFANLSTAGSQITTALFGTEKQGTQSNPQKTEFSIFSSLAEAANNEKQGGSLLFGQQGQAQMKQPTQTEVGSLGLPSGNVFGVLLGAGQQQQQQQQGGSDQMQGSSFFSKPLGLFSDLGPKQPQRLNLGQLGVNGSQ